MTVGVLMGGRSSERAISLVTGEAVYTHLDRSKYIVKKIELTEKGRFVFIPEKGAKRTLDLLGNDRRFVDCMFIALHGSVGEDGAVQGLLEVLGIAYTGPNILASAIAMNKVRTADIYRAAGIATPDFVHFTKKEWAKNKAEFLKNITTTIKYPCVVKPVDQGSAVGVVIAKNESELLRGVQQVQKKFDWLMVQTCIRGQEATCGVLEKRGVPLPLPPTHILPNYGEFYDYSSKYKKGGSTHVCPADFPEEINEEMQRLAVRAHRALWCRGMSRTDMFVDDKNKIWAIETNTIPGMTPTSLLPEAAAQAGMSFTEMLDLIILAAR